jgi:phosphoglycolate phosphatase-like HAD superfamily hydrolase
MGEPCYIFDIDGTLADCTHRLHYIQQHPKDWSAFYSACVDDRPIKHMVEVAKYLENFRPIVLVTGRSEIVRSETLHWLLEIGVFAARIYMRRDGDHREDSIIKIEMLQQIRDDGYEPIMVFEDRARVVAAWRVAGIPCAQVAEGQF